MKEYFEIKRSDFVFTMLALQEVLRKEWDNEIDEQ